MPRMFQKTFISCWSFLLRGIHIIIIIVFSLSFLFCQYAHIWDLLMTSSNHFVNVETNLFHKLSFGVIIAVQSVSAGKWSQRRADIRPIILHSSLQAPVACQCMCLTRVPPLWSRAVRWSWTTRRVTAATLWTATSSATPATWSARSPAAPLPSRRPPPTDTAAGGGRPLVDLWRNCQSGIDSGIPSTCAILVVKDWLMQRIWSFCGLMCILKFPGCLEMFSPNNEGAWTTKSQLAV